MSLIRLQDVTVGFGGPPVLENAHLTLDMGERVCLLGRNGEGKSTLLKLLQGELNPDAGELIRQQDLRIACLHQDVPANVAGRVEDIVAAAFPVDGNQDDWQQASQVQATLSRLGLDGDTDIGTLSGGMRRRVLLARALVSEPDILLLDEPTNHLDIEAIEWLEKFLRAWRGTLLFITHDRAFLRRLASRIVEIDRGALVSWPGDYANYLEKKQAALESEQRQQREFDRKLAREEAWIRQGIKARRTRNEGRVRALKKLRISRARRQSGAWWRRPRSR